MVASPQTGPDPYAGLIQSVQGAQNELESSFNEALSTVKAYVDGSMSEIEREHADQNRTLQVMMERMKAENEESKQIKIQRIQELHSQFVAGQLSLKDAQIAAIEGQLLEI